MDEQEGDDLKWNAWFCMIITFNWTADQQREAVIRMYRDYYATRNHSIWD